jgi:hypothetical protein
MLHISISGFYFLLVSLTHLLEKAAPIGVDIPHRLRLLVQSTRRRLVRPFTYRLLVDSLPYSFVNSWQTAQFAYLDCSNSFPHGKLNSAS